MTGLFNYKQNGGIYTIYYMGTLLFPLEGVMNTKIQAEHICRKLNSVIGG